MGNKSDVRDVDRISAIKLSGFEIMIQIRYV